MTAPPRRFVVPPSLDAQRLDQFVAAATTLSRRAARRLAAEGRIWRNGRPARVLSRTVATGDVIELLSEDVTAASPSVDPVTVLGDDGWLLAALKPAGVLSQPSETSGSSDLSLDQRLLVQLAGQEGRRPFLRLLHRLDRLTSGVLLFARRPQVLSPIAEAWRTGAVCRLYLGVVLGDLGPDARVVQAPIARQRDHRWRFSVDTRGRPAATLIRPLGRGPRDTTLVACLLRTGRTHQVRVHLAHLGHPVAGDRLYGGATDGVDRPLLHAAALRLPHPRTGEPYVAEAPLPSDFSPFLPEDLDLRRTLSLDRLCRTLEAPEPAPASEAGEDAEASRHEP
ncbi:MAG: RluA family pseudouridine synthase [Acidobacteria bacterium]|nr:RluA family pseudouridine synthase [Acidobacteriota bacterium]